MIRRITVVADFASLDLTLDRHPLALLRAKLSRMHLSTAACGYPHGRPARTAGIVIGRQRPDTASGVVIVTLEDEPEHHVSWRLARGGSSSVQD